MIVCALMGVSVLFRHMILEPKVKILGETEMFVKLYSSVQMTCNISSIITPPAFIFWLRNGRRIDQRSPHFIQSSEEISRVDSEEKTVLAKLAIPTVSKSHSGNYTCKPSGSLPSDMVILHVLNGKLCHLCSPIAKFWRFH